MPAPSWTTPAQFDLLSAHMADYIVRQAQKKVHKFWPIIWETFFRDHPVDGMLGIDKATATPEEWQTLQNAILAKKEQIKSWFRYQHRKATRGRASAARAAQSSLGNALFNAKPARRRVHRATEIFQKRNRDLVAQELSNRGHDELNEEHMAVDGKDLEAQEERTREARGERMRMRNEVVKELFAEAPEWEREEIEEEIRAERESLTQVGEQSSMGVSSQQRQIAIDESGDVMETVLKTLGEKTGWFSFAIWGGPNPRHDGELSLKCAVYGNTPAGNDFIAQHANYDEGISLPFQQFLQRCFLNGAVRPPIQPPADATALDGLITMTAGEEAPLPAEKPAEKPAKKPSKQASGKAAPKQMRKPKRAVPPAAPNPTFSAATLAPAVATTGPAPTPEASAEDSVGDGTDLLDEDTWLSSENLGAMADVFNSPTQPLPSSSPSTLRPGSLTLSTDVDRWPEGMSAPTSPRTAGRAAAAERGGLESTATYGPAVIDPALMHVHGTPPPPLRPRGCFTGAAFAPNRAPGDGEARRLHICVRLGVRGSEGQGSSSKSALPTLFDTYREITTTSPIRAFHDQEAYRRGVAARPRADIFALSTTPRPVFTPPRDAASGFFTSSSSSAPTPFTASSSSSSTSPSSTTLPPFVLPASSTPAAPAAPSPSVPTPSAPAPKPAVYNSRPMANLTKVAAKAAKAAVLGNTAAVVVANAAKKRGRKPRAVLTDITNAIADTPLPSSAAIEVPPVPEPSASGRTRGGAAGSSAPVGGNIQLCVAHPGGVRETLRREKEAGKRAKEREEREAEERRLASRMHNPDGNHDLVCVPAPRRSGRESKVPARPDEGYAEKVVSSTRGELGRRQGPHGLQIVPRGKRGNTAAAAPKTRTATTKTEQNPSASAARARGRK
ncbi:hypothetical protein C8F04DRAFT_1257328 [Mycena alexandri]|uniref:Uncharacterized protein n=1 Tax=Mycena alexandri TaxID=1745969 RepID=A0AAD6T398_9AGAR|nr:hypothetical protein C8F04DRAFT_1257328 [Mycena alexandri]